MSKKRFKKVYIEITNVCNLNCSFCGNNKREKMFMLPSDFERIIEKLNDYTDYVYLHVKGEPLLSPYLDEILSICDKYNKFVNITTNGTLLSEKEVVLIKHNCIRQINVSLHSENNIDNYFEKVFNTCKKLSEKIFISYRIWTLENLKIKGKSTEIVNKIISEYKLSTEYVDKILNEKSIMVDNNTFVEKENIFTWPDINNDFVIDGKCYGLVTHIGILVDGTVVPCCLDGNGDIPLGNIYDDSISNILNSELVLKMIEGFKSNKSVCDLCKKCDFRNRFIK